MSCACSCDFAGGKQGRIKQDASLFDPRGIGGDLTLIRALHQPGFQRDHPVVQGACDRAAVDNPLGQGPLFVGACVVEGEHLIRCCAKHGHASGARLDHPRAAHRNVLQGGNVDPVAHSAASNVRLATG
mmetsp:Transcript_13744/g.23419  ORF Transcript_13744/g.23419 Transcript_13744/m.23419 type:complete len:129 (-) Transcript_13744:5994-6380(-)